VLPMKLVLVLSSTNSAKFSADRRLVSFASIFSKNVCRVCPEMGCASPLYENLTRKVPNRPLFGDRYEEN
jgi:hypothetical protein